MTHTKITVLSAMLMFSLLANAQVKPSEIKYRRSSLHTIMIEDAAMDKSNIITEAYKKAPIPDKFNDHTLGERTFDPRNITLTADEAASIKKTSFASSYAKGIGSAVTGGLIDDKDIKDLPAKIAKYLTTQEVAKKLVAKWFNRSPKGAFNTQLISERGFYDASALDVNKAKASARGLATLADAGEELINNTFVIVSRFNYVSKKDLATNTKQVGSAFRGAFGSTATTLLGAAGNASNLINGYVVQSTTYLYKLVWNDSIQAVFYQEFWTDDSNFDPKKKEAFDKTQVFKLEFVGVEKAWADVPSSFGIGSRDPIARATEKSVDAVIAKLQREYEVFRTKTPLFTTEPEITAKIGLKEGLEKGDKYEVLEQTMDEKTGRTKYVKKGSIKVSELIWDNRMSPEEAAADTSKVKLDRTTFKGGSGYYPGMLIRQN